MCPLVVGTAAAARWAYPSTDLGRSKLITSGAQGTSGGLTWTSNITRNRGPAPDGDERHCCNIAFFCGGGISGDCRHISVKVFVDR
jgi:hypothetical protein